jgi:hypothetical protein
MAGTGPHNASYQIPELVISDTFHDWFKVTNQEVIDKLNRMSVYTVATADGISGSTSSGGKATFEIAKKITKDMQFDGDVTFNGTITRINSTNFSIDDYNIVLGDTGPGATASGGPYTGGTGASDAQIGASGGGGLILRRGSAGPDAEWLWKPTTGATMGGVSGGWHTNSHIKLDAAATFLSGDNSFRFQTGTTGEYLDIRTEKIPVDNYWGGTGSRKNDDLVLSYGATGATSEFLRVKDDGYVSVPLGINKKRLTKTNHGFTIGTVVRYDATTGYTAAIADSTENAEALGMVSYAKGSEFEITYSGEIRGDFRASNAAGTHLSSGIAYFLSAAAGATGKFTESAPSSTNQVKKPMMVATGTGEGLVVNYIGGIIQDATEASATSQRITINTNPDSTGITANYFLIGDAVRVDKTASKYVRAQCNNSVDAEVIGLITKTNVGGDSSTFHLTTGGKVSFETDEIEATGMVVGSVYFLNNNCAAVKVQGNCLTKDEPETIGFVRKPLMTAISTTEAVLTNYVGMRVWEESGGQAGDGSGIVSTQQMIYFDQPKDFVDGLPMTHDTDAGYIDDGTASTAPGPAFNHVYNGQYNLFDSEKLNIPTNAEFIVIQCYTECNQSPNGGSGVYYNKGGVEVANSSGLKIGIGAGSEYGDFNTTTLPVDSSGLCWISSTVADSASPVNAKRIAVLGYIASASVTGNYTGEEVDITSEQTVMLSHPIDFITGNVIPGTAYQATMDISAATEVPQNTSGLSYDLFSYGIPSEAEFIIVESMCSSTGNNSSNKVKYWATDNTTWDNSEAIDVIISAGNTPNQTLINNKQSILPLHSSGKCMLYNYEDSDQQSANNVARMMISGYIKQKTQKVTTGAVSNAISSSVKRKNINGNFDFWQRGVIFGATQGWGSNQWSKRYYEENHGDHYVADMWHTIGASGSNWAVSKEEFNFAGASGSGVDYLPEASALPAQYYMKVKNNGSALSEPGSMSIQTVIEDATVMHGKKVAYSFWAKGDVSPQGTGLPNNIKLRFWQYAGITGGQAYGAHVLEPISRTKYVLQNNITTPVTTQDHQLLSDANTWRKIFGVMTLPSVGGQLCAGGATFGHATAGVGCLGVEFIVSTDSTGWTGEFSIAQFQLEEGGVNSRFETRDQDLELTSCQRYFETSMVTNYSVNGASQNAYGATNQRRPYRLSDVPSYWDSNVRQGWVHRKGDRSVSTTDHHQTDFKTRKRMQPQATSISMSGITHAANFDPSTHLNISPNPHSATAGLAWNGSDVSAENNYSNQTIFTYDAFKKRDDWASTDGKYPTEYGRSRGVNTSPTGIDTMSFLDWDLREGNTDPSRGHYLDLRKLYNGQTTNPDDSIININAYFDNAYGNTSFAPVEIFFHYVVEAGF